MVGPPTFAGFHNRVVVTWRRAQIVLLSAQRMSPTNISEVVFTGPDTVGKVIHNFNRDGFDALYPRYAGGRQPAVTVASAARDQEDRAVGADRPRPAVRDLEPGQGRRLPGRRGGGHRHLPRGPARPVARRASPFKR